MKMKGTDTTTAKKEADVSNYACEDEEEPLPCLRFPFLSFYTKDGATSGHNLKKVSIQFYRIKNIIL
jgi:hypothetical protein